MHNRAELIDWALARGLRRTGRGNLALPVLCRSVPQSDGRLDVTISTDSVDRHGDIVEPSGADLDAFRRNPVVMWAHDYRNLPIGRAEQVRVEGNALRASVLWAPTDFAGEVAELYRRGYLRGWSIGFRPIEWEERRDDKGALLGYRITRWELLEFSGVPIPANAEALTNAARDGLLTHRSLIKSLGLAKGDVRVVVGARHALPLRGDGPQSAPRIEPATPPEPAATRAGGQAVEKAAVPPFDRAWIETRAQEVAARMRERLRSIVGELIRADLDRRMGRT